MCELFGISSDRRATTCLSLMALAEHGGISGPHKDGWGVAYSDIWRKRTKTGYFWGIVSDDRGHGGPSPPIVLFHYAPGRGAIHAEAFLSGYGGRFLQYDGHEAYDKMTVVERPLMAFHHFCHE